jgi:hypothetical protein
MPQPKDATEKPTTPRFMLPRHKDKIASDAEAQRALEAMG